MNRLQSTLALIAVTGMCQAAPTGEELMKQIQERLAHPLLVQAAADGNTESVMDRLASGDHLETNNPHTGWTALIAASYHGKTAVVDLLLRRGASLRAADVNGKQALHHAAAAGHGKVVQQLIDGGAALELGDTLGYTPLIYAAMEGRVDIVQSLVKQGAEIESGCLNNLKPLHWAALYQRTDTAKTLVQLGADVNAVSTAGGTPQTYARVAGGPEGLLALLAPTDPNAPANFHPVKGLDELPEWKGIEE